MKYAAILLIACSFVFEANTNLNKCIAKTVEKVFAENQSVIYVYYEIMSIPETNPRILLDLNFPFYMASTYKNYHYNYIIHGEDMKRFRRAFDVLVQYHLWTLKQTSEGKLLLVTSEKDLEEIVVFIWKVGVINLVVLVYDTSGATRVFTSDPQAPENNCGLSLKKCLSVVDCFSSTPILFPKIFRKYTNCKITSVVPTADELEIRKITVFKTIHFILDLIVERFNASLKNAIPTDVAYQLGLHYIVLKEYTLLPNYYITLPFFDDNMVWMVPFAQRISLVQSFQKIFKKIVWVYILVAFVGASLTWWLITKVSNGTSSISKVFLKMLSITLFGFVDKFGMGLSMRCLFLTYVLYSIHNQMGFTSRLIENLITSHYGSRINNLDELANSNISIYVSDSYYQKFFEHGKLNGTLYNKIRARLVKLPQLDYPNIIGNNHTYIKSGSLLTKSEYEMLQLSYEIDFCTIDGSNLPLKLKYVFAGSENAYILKTVNKLISLLMESGMLNSSKAKVENGNQAQTKFEIAYLVYSGSMHGESLIVKLRTRTIVHGWGTIKRHKDSERGYNWKFLIAEVPSIEAIKY
ncbi:hypothetical protein FQR65_LT00360 [Abscondita terminalis]|nr:hypothetical protein FQR65_LT00360 [Abscondita terminalis]